MLLKKVESNRGETPKMNLCLVHKPKCSEMPMVHAYSLTCINTIVVHMHAPNTHTERQREGGAYTH